MKRPRFLLPLLLVPLLLAGCETINPRDRTVLREHDVPQDVFDKMLYGDPLSLDDIIALSQRGVPPGLIIHYINETDTAYRLRKVDVKRLRAAGVTEDVIAYMLSTAPPYAPIYGGGYPYPAPYGYPYGPYYYGDYLGPVVVVGGYGRWGWGHGGWGHGGWGRHR